MPCLALGYGFIERVGCRCRRRERAGREPAAREDMRETAGVYERGEREWDRARAASVRPPGAGCAAVLRRACLDLGCCEGRR